MRLPVDLRVRCIGYAKMDAACMHGTDKVRIKGFSVILCCDEHNIPNGEVIRKDGLLVVDDLRRSIRDVISAAAIRSLRERTTSKPACAGANEKEASSTALWR